MYGFHFLPREQVFDFNIIQIANNSAANPKMSMYKFTFFSRLSGTRRFCGIVPQSYINTPVYKTDSANFRTRHVGRHYREYGVNATDNTYSPFPPGMFPPTQVSIPHDPSFLITSAFCPRVLSIEDMILPSVSINRILISTATMEKYDIPTTALVFGDAAITLVKKGMSSKKPVVVQEATVMNYHPATAKETTTQPFSVRFGDAQPISVPNSRFRNTTTMAKQNVVPLARLTSPYRRVVNETTDINMSNIVIQTKRSEEQTTAPINVSLRPPNTLESKNHNPLDFAKTVSLPRLMIQPKSSTTRRTRSVFDTRGFKKHRALIRKDATKDTKVTEVVDNEYVTSQPANNDIGLEIVKDFPTTTENLPKTATEVKNAPFVVVAIGARSGIAAQSEFQIITRLSPTEDPSLVNKQTAITREFAEPMTLHSPSQCSVESSQPTPRGYSPTDGTRMNTDAVGGVKFSPVQDCATINTLRCNVETIPLAPKYSIRPKALASACDYASLFDARARSKGVESTKPEPSHIILPAIEPQYIPAVNDMRSLQAVRDVTRQFDLVPPGTGTLLGPRNDNDWRDITKIQIMPTIDELLPGRKTVYMPRKEKMFPLSRVLDLAFRHYRESSLGPVRDCTADAMARMVQRAGFPSTTIEAAGAAYNVYHNARVEGCHCTEGRFASPAFSLAFTSPGHEHIAQEKVLRGGHLLALLTLSGVEVKVAWLKAVGGWSDRDGYGRISAIGMCILDSLLYIY